MRRVHRSCDGLGRRAAARSRSAEVAVPNTGFDIVVAMAQPGAPMVDFRGQPDPTVGYTAGGRLVLAVDDKVEKLLKDVSFLQRPSCSFDADRKPVAVFIVPNGEKPVARQREAAVKGQLPTVSVMKMEVSGTEFAIVFGLSKSWDSGPPAFEYIGEADTILIPAIVPMPNSSCITYGEPNADTTVVVTAYVVPKEGKLGPPMQ